MSFFLRDDRDKSIDIAFRPRIKVKNVYTRILMIIKAEPSLFPKKHFVRSTVAKYLLKYDRTDLHEKYLRARWKHIDFDNYFVCQAIGQCFHRLAGPNGQDLLVELAQRGNELWQEVIHESAPTLWEGDRFFKIKEAYSNTSSFRVCKWFPELLFRNYRNEVIGVFRPVMVKYRFRNSARDAWTVRFSKLCDTPEELIKEFDMLTIDPPSEDIFYEETEEVIEEAFDYSVFRYSVSLFAEIEHP